MRRTHAINCLINEVTALFSDGNEVIDMTFMRRILARHPAVNLAVSNAKIAGYGILPPKPVKGFSDNADFV
jgi:hypothetical protein